MRKTIFLLVSKFCNLCVFWSTSVSDKINSRDTKSGCSKEERLGNSDPKKDNADNACFGNDDSKLCLAYFICRDRWEIALFRINQRIKFVSSITTMVIFFFLVYIFEHSKTPESTWDEWAFSLLLIPIVFYIFYFIKLWRDVNNCQEKIDELNKNMFFYLECDKKSQEKLNNFINKYKYDTYKEKKGGNKKEV